MLIAEGGLHAMLWYAHVINAHGVRTRGQTDQSNHKWAVDETIRMISNQCRKLRRHVGLPRDTRTCACFGHGTSAREVNVVKCDVVVQRAPRRQGQKKNPDERRYGDCSSFLLGRTSRCQSRNAVEAVVARRPLACTFERAARKWRKCR